jgi:hypothetical protein
MPVADRCSRRRAGRAWLSSSLSRLFSAIAIELERRGPIERRRSENDSRSTEVAITDAGRAQLQAAAPAYLQTIRAHLFEALNERDIKQLARIWKRIGAAKTLRVDTGT